MAGLRLRIYILRRDGYRCVYCGAEPARCYLELDHVIPRSAGGLTHPSNLVTACRTCNLTKLDRAAPLPKVVRDRLARDRDFDWAQLGRIA